MAIFWCFINIFINHNYLSWHQFLILHSHIAIPQDWLEILLILTQLSLFFNRVVLKHIICIYPLNTLHWNFSKVRANRKYHLQFYVKYVIIYPSIHEIIIIYNLYFYNYTSTLHNLHVCVYVCTRVCMCLYAQSSIYYRRWLQIYILLFCQHWRLFGIRNRIVNS